MFCWLFALSFGTCVLIRRRLSKSTKSASSIKGVPLSPIEVFYFRDYTSCPGQFNLVIPVEISFLKDFNHTVFVNNLKCVLNAIQRKHPLLQASVVCENNTLDIINDNWYFTWDHKKPIPLHIVDTDDYQQIMRQEMHKGFPLHGPMIRATLCRGKKYHLVVTAFHLVVDGGILLNLVKEIITMLNRMDHKDANSKKNQEQIALMDKIETRPVPKSLTEQLYPKYQLSTFSNWIFFLKFMYMEINNIGLKGVTFPLSTGVEKQKSDFIIFELDRDTTSRIIKRAKEHKVSVSSLLGAASAFVASKYVKFAYPGQPIPVPFPFDLRRNVPEVTNTVEDVRPLSTGIYTYLKVQDNIWDMAKSCQQQISEMVKSDLGIRFYNLYKILPKIAKGGNDNRCLVVSSFPPDVYRMDSCDQFHARIRGFVMSSYNTTNMVSVYLLTIEEKFLFNVYFNTSIQTEVVRKYAKSLEQYMRELGSAVEV